MVVKIESMQKLIQSFSFRNLIPNLPLYSQVGKFYSWKADHTQWVSKNEKIGILLVENKVYNVYSPESGHVVLLNSGRGNETALIVPFLYIQKE